MNPTLRQVSTALSLLEHVAPNRDMTVADALAYLRNGILEKGVNVEPVNYNKPHTIFDVDSGLEGAMEMLKNSPLRDQIEHWRKQEELKRKAMGESNVNFLEDWYNGAVALVTSAVDRINARLDKADQIPTDDQTRADAAKRDKERAEAKRKADEEEKKRLEAERNKPK